METGKPTGSDDVIHVDAPHPADVNSISFKSHENNNVPKEEVTLVMSGDHHSTPIPTPSAPAGSTHLVPVVLKSRKDAFFNYPMVTILIRAYNACNVFNGYATKVLLSSMFELVFQLPIMTSAYLRALSLLLFVAARAAVPYYLMDSKFSATYMCCIATLVSSAGYAVLPSIVGDEAFNEADLSGRLVGFVIVKSLVGGCFACLSSLTSSVVFDVVGQANMPTFFRLGWSVAGFFAALGPILAFDMTMNRYHNGMNFSEAFHCFFYTAAGVALLNTGLFSVIHCLLYRRNSKL